MFNELLLRQSLILGVSVVDDAFTRTIDLLVPALGWKKPKKCGFGEILYGYTHRFIDLSDEVFKQLFDLVSEIVATRNILTHNLGKVDEKYLSKFPTSGLHVGDTRVINHAYVSQSLLYLEGFTKTILEIAQSQFTETGV
jgi:hypothetical protein